MTYKVDTRGIWYLLLIGISAAALVAGLVSI
jgi:hypothetical protein